MRGIRVWCACVCNLIGITTGILFYLRMTLNKMMLFKCE